MAEEQKPQNLRRERQAFSILEEGIIRTVKWMPERNAEDALLHGIHESGYHNNVVAAAAAVLAKHGIESARLPSPYTPKTDLSREFKESQNKLPVETVEKLRTLVGRWKREDEERRTATA